MLLFLKQHSSRQVVKIHSGDAPKERPTILYEVENIELFELDYIAVLKYLFGISLCQIWTFCWYKKRERVMGQFKATLLIKLKSTLIVKSPHLPWHKMPLNALPMWLLTMNYRLDKGFNPTWLQYWTFLSNFNLSP